MMAYASITHWTSANVECRPDWISGSATITIVTSSRSMNVAAQTTTSVHHFLSIAVSSPGFTVSPNRPV